jgi:hypothetical protein
LKEWIYGFFYRIIALFGCGIKEFLAIYLTPDNSVDPSTPAPCILSASEWVPFHVHTSYYPMIHTLNVRIPAILALVVSSLIGKHEKNLRMRFQRP